MMRLPFDNGSYNLEKLCERAMFMDFIQLLLGVRLVGMIISTVWTETKLIQIEKFWD